VIISSPLEEIICVYQAGQLAGNGIYKSCNCTHFCVAKLV